MDNHIKNTKPFKANKKTLINVIEFNQHIIYECL